MRSIKKKTLFNPRFVLIFAGLLSVSGTLLWHIARSGEFASAEALLKSDSIPRSAWAALVLFFALLATLFFLYSSFTRPIHQLVEYVESQRHGTGAPPPAFLLERNDDIGLLSQEIQRLLQTLRDQNERLLEQSLNDPLTGLGNRRLLEQRLDVVLPINRRRMAPLSVLMVDVDHFKDYNDLYGHPAGDDCLQVIADVLRDAFRRETDIVVRLGGEEFLVVLLDIDLDEATRLAEAMRSMLQAIGLPHGKSSAADVVTVSIGVATAKPGTPIDVERLIASADAALYQCKAKGRNCSVGCIVDPPLQDQTVSAPA